MLAPLGCTWRLISGETSEPKSSKTWSEIDALPWQELEKLHDDDLSEERGFSENEIEQMSLEDYEAMQRRDYERLRRKHGGRDPDELAEERDLDVSGEPSWFQRIWATDLSKLTPAEREWRRQRKNKWDRGSPESPAPLPDGVCTDEPGDPEHFVSNKARQLWHRRIHAMTRDEFEHECAYSKESVVIAYNRFLDELERRENERLERETKEGREERKAKAQGQQAKQVEQPSAHHLEQAARAERAKAEKTIQWVRASDWHGKPVPERRWLVPKFIPYRNVTQHTGDGGVGKSLLDLQLAVAVVANRKWVGMPVNITGPVIVYSAEDELEETWRRVADICKYEGIELKDLRNLFIAPLAGMDAMLSVADERGGGSSMTPTPLWHQLVSKANAVRPKLVVIDTSADVFGGDEIKRRQVRQFVGMLRGLAFDFDCAVVLLSHPSVSGMMDGTGRSGSTGWNNAFRGRMYQERVTARDGTVVVETDPDLRVLRNNKLNYGRTGTEVRIRYNVEHNVFVNEQVDDVSTADAAVAAERAFLECLAMFESQCRDVSPRPGPNYAPAVFAKLSQAKGYNKRQLADAMERLLDDKVIRFAQEGSASRPRRWLTRKPEPVSGETPDAVASPIEAAKAFLREFLSEGPRTASEVMAFSAGGMIADKTLRKAATEIGVKIVQQNRSWIWSSGRIGRCVNAAVGRPKNSDGRPISTPLKGSDSLSTHTLGLWESEKIEHLRITI